MKNSIGGLFRRKRQAGRAYETLRKLGFGAEDVSILEQRESDRPQAQERFPGQSVAVSAAIGAVTFAILAGILGFLIGQGIITVPGFNPNLERGTFLELFTLALFMGQGAVTGAILGVAFRLLTSPHKVEITPNGIRRGGVLVVVNADETERAKVIQAMKEAGASDLENLTQIWDQSVWSRFEKIPPSTMR